MTDIKTEVRERIATQLSFIEDVENIKLITKAIYSIVDVTIDKAVLAERERTMNIIRDAIWKFCEENTDGWDTDDLIISIHKAINHD